MPTLYIIIKIPRHVLHTLPELNQRIIPMILQIFMAVILKAHFVAGHQDDARPDHAGEGDGARAHPAGGQQGGPGGAAGGPHRRGDGPRPDLGLLLRREQRQEQDQRQRGLRRDRQRDEPQVVGRQGQGDRLHLLRKRR